MVTWVRGLFKDMHDADEAAVAESHADFGAGRTVSHEEMPRKHG